MATDADKQEIDVLMKRPDEPLVALGGFNKLMGIGKGGSAERILGRSRKALKARGIL